ncbi:MAG: hypothetical protein H0W21_06265 [Actinobacteria bacterium]|nr:hypothetical protein [Actinomycetota bacterium]
MFFLDEGTALKSLRGWTDQAEPDVFVALASGRSPFRCSDLLALAELIDGFLGDGGGEHV